jgi:uncharacterized repeat protein (TIGR01451 family)
MTSSPKNWLSRPVRRTAALGAVLLLLSGCKHDTLDPTVPADPAAVTFGSTSQSVSVAFPSDSLIVPMHVTGTDAQNSAAVLRAYGYVYRLLVNNIPVYWVINPLKTTTGGGTVNNGADLVFTAPNTTVGIVGGAPTASRSYLAGPFVIHANDRAAALTHLSSFNSGSPDPPDVYIHSANQPFTAEVARTLTAAPRLAVFADGNEDIAFDDLNAAGIPDSANTAWPDSNDTSVPIHPGRVDILDRDEVFGGSLQNADASPVFCMLVSMHWVPSSGTPTVAQVVNRVEEWLSAGSTTHGFMQCDATRIFENEGLQLTTGGHSFTEEPGQTLAMILDPAHPLTQFQGAMQIDNGSVDHMQANNARPGVVSLLRWTLSGDTALGDSALLTGRHDGNTSHGRVTYLAGHNYSTSSSSNQFGGVRVFMNAILYSPCATAEGQPAFTFTKSGPAATTGTTIDYTLTLTNSGPGVASGVVVTDAIPAGSTFVSADNGGTFSAGTITWNLGNVGVTTRTLTFRVSVSADNTYVNTGALSFTPAGTRTLKTMSSNTVSTIRDTVPPTTTILTGPAQGSFQASADATFTFSSNEGTATFECQLDGAGFSACTTPKSYTGLAQGSHTFQVRARDVAGNVDATPESRTWTVDTVPPNTTITASPPAATNQTTASFTFTSTESPATFQCQLDSGAFTACNTGSQSYSGLADGSHTFNVRASDQAGNQDATPATFTWVVDTAAPNTTITQSPTSPTNLSSATFNFTSSEGSSTFECQLDGAGFSACAGPITYNSLSAGDHTFQVRAKDAAQNTDPSPASFTWTIDVTAPDTTLTSTPPVASNSASATFGFTATESPATFECQLDSGAFVACTSTQTYPSLAEGPHTFAVRARDAAGNQDATPATFGWTVDLTKPNTFIVSNPPNPSNQTSAGFDFSSNESGVAYECSLDSGAFASCPDPHAITGLAAGSHTLQVRAKDAALNVDDTPASYTWVIDLTAPDTAITSAPAAQSNSSTATFAFNSPDDPAATFECRIDGAAFASCTSPIGYLSLSDGAHSFSVRARDAATNVDATPAVHNWTVDTVAPNTTITSQPPLQSNSTSATFTFASTESGTFECQLDGGAYAACSATSTFNNLSQGSHTVNVRAKDDAGNVDATPATYTWTVDTIEPETSITSGPPAQTNLTAATFSFSSDTPTATYECKLDTQMSFTACTNPITFTNLQQGVRTLDVRARDDAGNTDMSPAQYTWLIDTGAPETTIDSFPPAQSPSTSATFGFTSDDPLATFECRLDGATMFTACSDPVTFPGLSQGAHSLEVRARDLAGNVDLTPAQYSWTVDSIAPDTFILSAPPANSASTSATFDFSSNETGVSYECSIDSAPFAACGDPLTLSSLAQGAHSLVVQAKDGAGNIDASPATHNWNVDTIVPPAPVIGSPADGAATSNPNVTVSGTAEAGVTVRLFLDNVSVGTTTAGGGGTWSIPLAAVAEGTHTLRAQAQDAAGNTSGFSATTTFTVDTVAPSPPVVSQPVDNAITNNPRPPVSGTSEANALITVRIDGAVVGTTNANGAGAWSLTLTADVPNGTHTLRATATDAANNTSLESAAKTFTVDTSAPAAPTITVPSANAILPTGRPTITGTAEPGSTVEVRIDTTTVVATGLPTDGSGNWTYTLTAGQTLLDGGHNVTARATDPAGNTGSASSPVNFTVDTSAPAAPTITAPAAGSRTNDTTPDVVGTAEANATVRIYVDGALQGTTTATGSGAFTFTIPAPLAEGNRTVTAEAIDVAGNIGPLSAPLTFTIDLTAPAAPQILTPPSPTQTNDSTPTLTGVAEPLARVNFFVGSTPAGFTTADASGNWTMTLAVLADGTHSVTAVAVDVAGNSSNPSAATTLIIDTGIPSPPSITIPLEGARTNDNTPEVSGTAEPNASVSLYVDGVLRGNATANGSGAWVTSISTPLAEGLRTLTATATDAAGNTSAASPARTFTIDTSAPLAPIISAPVNGSTTSDETPLVSGTAEPFATVTLFVNGVASGTTPALGTGAWSIELSTLADGIYTLRAHATDEAGNTGPLSTSTSFTVDTSAPPPPALATPADGSFVGTSRPTVTGTAEPGATISVLFDNNPAGTTTAAPSGSWSFTPVGALLDGPHTVSATASDAAGNTSGSSATNNFTVDTEIPAPPVITSPTAGQIVSDPRIPISGTAEANAFVEVRVDGVLFGIVTADPLGAWSYTPSVAQSLSNAPHTVVARTIDRAGNTSSPSASVTFIVDTVAPQPPVVTAPANGSRTGDDTPTISGTAEADSTVNVIVDGEVVGTNVATGGAWSYTLDVTQALADGNHTATAFTVDAAGNTSGNATTVSFVVDLTPPAPPAITQPLDNAHVGVSTPTITGTAEPLATVTVFIGSTAVVTTNANGSGNWSVALPSQLDGTYVLTATARDTSGNTSDPSTAITITIDTSAPAAPAITSPASGAHVATTTPTVSGTGEAGATLTVFDGATALGTTVVAMNGTWTFPVPPGSPLAQGDHTLRASATDAAGNTGPLSAAVTITVDTLAPAPPTITSPTPNQTLNQRTPTIIGTAEVGTTVTVTIDDVPIGSAVAGAGGIWSVTPTVPLMDGSHSARATAVDSANNASAPSTAVPFVIDTSAPGSTRITTPVNGAQLNDTTPTVTGEAEALSTVEVFAGAVSVGTTTVAANGTWSLTIAPALAEGSYTLTARATDTGGNPGPLSDAVGITIDITAPDPPTISAPSEDARVPTNTPTISGTALAGERISVRIGAGEVGSVVAGESGAWSYTLTASQALTDGAYIATAVARDAAGNESAASADRNFTVDTGAPIPPIITLPLAGSVSNNTLPTISGTAEANATVRVFVNGTLVGTVAAVGVDWTYTLTAMQALPEGTHKATAVAVDAAGNASLPSTERSFVVDLTAPAAPSVATPEQGQSLPSSQPTISGSAEPGASVTVTIGTTVVGTAVAQANGTWTLVSSVTFTDGPYSLTATATDAAGNTGAPSPARGFVIDTSAPAAPDVTAPQDNQVLGTPTPTISGTAEPLSRVRVFIDGDLKGETAADGSGAFSYTLHAGQALPDGNFEASALAIDAAGNESPISSAHIFQIDTQPPARPIVTLPLNGALTNDTTPAIAGTAEAGSTVEVFIDNVSVGTAPVDGSGAWSLQPTTELLEGPHEITARATDTAGNPSGNASIVTLIVDLTPPGAPSILTPADGSSTSDRTPTLVGTAEPNSTVAVFVGGEQVGTTTASATGAWTFTIPDLSPLDEGLRVLTAQATDLAGNTSAASSPTSLIVDTTPPPVPVISQPESGAQVSTNTPTFSGTAEPGARVELRVDEQFFAVVTANVDGDWSFATPPSQGLPAGPHQVTARAIDPAGNTSAASAARPFTVDVTAPPTPAITSPQDGARTNLNQPTIGGTAEPGTTVTLFIDGQVMGNVPTNPDGTWSYTLTMAQTLADQTYVARAIAIDSAGNPSAASTPVAFTVDTTAPAAPVFTQPAEASSVGTGRPTFRGTAEPNARVTLTIQGTPINVNVNADADGNWTYTLGETEVLQDGSYSATAVAQDAAGNVSVPSDVRTFTVDTQLPGKPVITSPTAGERVASSTPTVSGTSEAFARVTVSIDGIARGEAAADSMGRWSYTLTAGQALADGSHTASAVARDPGGNLSGESDPVGFVVDTMAPAPPRITSPADGTQTRSTTPGITGTGEPGTLIQVFIDGDLVGTVMTDANGGWTFTPTSPVADGMHTIAARALDASGNSSEPSTPVTVNVDTKPPEAPVITQPPDGAITNNSSPTIAGTSEPGAQIEVFVDGTLVGTTTAGADGNWRYTLTPMQALSDGEHVVTARATDTVGNVGPSTTERSFTVDTVVPAPPEIQSPAQGEQTADNTPTFRGTAESGTRVLVYVDDVLVGMATTSDNGTWSFTPAETAPIADGVHTVTARATDTSGNRSPPSTAITFVVDTVAPNAPIITAPPSGSTVTSGTPTIAGTGEPGTKVDVYIDGVLAGTVTVGGDGRWTFTPTPSQALPDGAHQVIAQGKDGAGNVSEFSQPIDVQVQGAALDRPTVLTPREGARLSDATPDVTGTAAANGIVEVFIDGVSVGTTVADAAGRWTLTLVTPLADGDHTVTARQRDGAGRASELTTPVRFSIDTHAPAPPSLDPLPEQTNDRTPEISGTAEPGTTIEVSVNGVPVGTATVNADGTWSFELPTQPDGTQTITVVAIDPAGNRSTPPTEAQITIETELPPPPMIDTPEHDSVHLSDPTITGRGRPQHLLRLSLDGSNLPPVRVRTDGTWIVYLPAGTSLPLGRHTLVAVQSDDLGNVSAPSNTVEFAIGFAEGSAFMCSSSPTTGRLPLVWLVALALAVLAWRRRRDGRA